MTKSNLPVGCACCDMSRRNFLASGCAACVGAAGLLAAPRMSFAQNGTKPRVRIVYSLHAEVQPGPDWPNVGFDFKPVMEKIQNTLQQGCPEIEFLTAMATGEEQAKAILEADTKEKVEGYVVYQLNCWNRVVQTMATSGKPVLYADFQFGGSGGFLVYNAGFLRQGTPNLGFVASSNMDDLVAAAKCFAPTIKSGNANDFAATVAKARIANTPEMGNMECKPDSPSLLSVDDWKAKIAESRILAVLDQEARPADPVMGINVEYITFKELNDAWEKADKDEAKAVADKWQNGAIKIEDVSRETLETSAAMYLAQKEVLKKHNANAITVNCLGGFYGGHIHAYPCLGFHELNNEGLIGACECDVRSTATMVAFTTLTNGRPGYISDPVMDTAKRQIIYAHCVASNKAFGPDGKTNDYEILTHSEDRQGAAVRSILPTGYMTTSMEVSEPDKEILFHQAKAVENDPDDRACRTKICGEPVGDMEKLFTQWDRWGWHRVTFYGDLKKPVYELADAIGWKVVEEA